MAPEGLQSSIEGADSAEGVFQISESLGIISLSLKFHKDPSWFGRVIWIYIAPEGLQSVIEGADSKEGI